MEKSLKPQNLTITKTTKKQKQQQKPLYQTNTGTKQKLNQNDIKLSHHRNPFLSRVGRDGGHGHVEVGRVRDDRVDRVGRTINQFGLQELGDVEGDREEDDRDQVLDQTIANRLAAVHRLAVIC